jgi:hypothetical protein
LDSIRPTDGKLEAKVQVSHARMQAVARRGMGQTKECGLIVPWILKNPTAIFEGVRRDDDDDDWGDGWLCYCGIPEQSFDVAGTPGPPYRFRVYVVFVNHENVAYNWRWEESDPDDVKLPLNFQDRFKKRLL